MSAPNPHNDIAVGLLTDMFNRNLALAARMLEVGDCDGTKKLLQSAITQVDQIASYQPQTKPANNTITEV